MQLCFFLSYLLLPSIVTATPSLPSIFTDAARQQSTLIDYREIRHMQLLEQPWLAEGRMYLTAETFVMAQQQPEYQLLIIKKNRFWFYNPAHGGRHQGSIAAMQQGLDLLQPIIHGDIAAIERLFIATVTKNRAGWMLDLVPRKPNGSPYVHIIVKGRDGSAADYLLTESADGDSSEWFLTARPLNEDARKAMDQAITESRGY